VVRQARPATSARSPKDAFLLVLNEGGTLDFARMAVLLGPGTTPDSVRDTLAAEGLIFEDPHARWQTADAYLSGNVKRKLAVAEKAALAESRFQCNVEALRLVIPANIPPGQIEVRLGTHWIPATDVNDFLREVLHAEEPRWSSSGGQFVRYVALSRAEAPDPVYRPCEYVDDVGRTRALRLVSDDGIGDDSPLPHSCEGNPAQSQAHSAICARERKPSFNTMFSTRPLAVRSPMTS
jgi:hypothetical protein